MKSKEISKAIPFKPTEKIQGAGATEMTAAHLAALEPIIDQLLAGSANPKDVAARLAKLGYPSVLDQTEQLRLALRLLECHDERKPTRSPEADLA